MHSMSVGLLQTIYSISFEAKPIFRAWLHDEREHGYLDKQNGAVRNTNDKVKKES